MYDMKMPLLGDFPLESGHRIRTSGFRVQGSGLRVKGQGFAKYSIRALILCGAVHVLSKVCVRRTIQVELLDDEGEVLLLEGRGDGDHGDHGDDDEVVDIERDVLPGGQIVHDQSY